MFLASALQLWFIAGVGQKLTVGDAWRIFAGSRRASGNLE